MWTDHPDLGQNSTLAVGQNPAGASGPWRWICACLLLESSCRRFRLLGNFTRLRGVSASLLSFFVVSCPLLVAQVVVVPRDGQPLLVWVLVVQACPHVDTVFGWGTIHANARPVLDLSRALIPIPLLVILGHKAVPHVNLSAVLAPFFSILGLAMTVQGCVFKHVHQASIGQQGQLELRLMHQSTVVEPIAPHTS